ncbi:PaaI family thioesterase [Actinomadura sp.]|uniref:PaaI family thioesterase n=1 Tax=Actinomadura sp. TaxID=1989 RepID=UPI0037C630B5
MTLGQNMLYEFAEDLPPGEVRAVEPGTAPVPDGCLLDVLGIEPTHIGRGACRARMRIGARHLNQRGLVQGGAIVALADAAAGWASYAALREGRFTTLELNCDFMGRAAEGGVLRGAPRRTPPPSISGGGPLSWT